MLTSQRLFNDDRVEISNVTCQHRRGRGREEEPTGGHSIVFVRRGCFIRSVNGVAGVLDPTLAYCMNPGDEQRYDHPHDGGDDCTSIFLCADLAAHLWGGEPRLPTEPLVVTPQLDLAHRLLLGALRRGAADEDMSERAISLAASALATIDPRRITSGRPGTERARRALAEAAREMLALDPQASLPELARSLTVSPYHLSRVFRTVTGRSISRHRMRLRARAALERLAAGEHDLARLAADVGFADQSHLCRVIRQETGSTPSALRRALE